MLQHSVDINIKNKEGKSALYFSIVNENSEMINCLINCRGIVIGENEYHSLIKLAQKNPQDENLQTCMRKAQPLFIYNIMWEQLRALKEKYPQYYNKTLPKLKTAKKNIFKKKNLSEKEKYEYLLNRMMPVFTTAPIEYHWTSLWQQEKLSHRILNHIKKTGIDLTSFKTADYSTPLTVFC